MKSNNKVLAETKCPAAPKCKYHTGHPPAMAAHIRGNHPELWKKNLKDTLGYTMTRTTRGSTGLLPGKPLPLPPWLELELDEPRRKGRKPMIVDDPKRAETLRKKREYNAKWRAKKRAKGLTSTGQPYKRPPKGHMPQPLEQSEVAETRAVRKDVRLTQGRVFINRCPGCGKLLDPHYVAAGIAANMDYEEAKAKVNLYEANQNQ